MAEQNGQSIPSGASSAAPSTAHPVHTSDPATAGGTTARHTSNAHSAPSGARSRRNAASRRVGPPVVAPHVAGSCMVAWSVTSRT